MRFKIDFFELSFLTESCIPPVPIARHGFWIRLIDEIYYELSPSERLKLYGWISDNWKFKSGLDKEIDSCLIFKARFELSNQYDVETKNGEVVENCFLMSGKYHITSTRSIPQENIKKVTSSSS